MRIRGERPDRWVGEPVQVLPAFDLVMTVSAPTEAAVPGAAGSPPGASPASAARLARAVPTATRYLRWDGDGLLVAASFQAISSLLPAWRALLKRWPGRRVLSRWALA